MANTPFDVTSGTIPNTTATGTFTVGSGVVGTPVGAPAGSLVLVCWGTNAGGSQTLSSVSDSQSNPYALVTQTTSGGGGNYASLWASRITTALVSGTDTITVTASSSTGVKLVGVRGIAGVASATANASNEASSSAAGTNPSSGSTGTLPIATEYVIGVLNCHSGSGTPTGLSFGTGETVQSNGLLTFFDTVTSSTSALTASGTITSATWSALIAAWPFVSDSDASNAATEGVPATIYVDDAVGFP